ncbi:M28 family metallopeptidase [Paracraurococcus ruber]|uniref:Aminopeptidase n=1 Tax=Paracraurococcus ruber TaxID=77675 RepID=A0ABS1CUV6_9PROT|nr:M28 family peptidase [Paracraurococcus ruber]MBK1658115.1 aminopeptidase [Paracraurococcus ruber]TDG29137.1 Zn-dependent exopeptidase M28 [Paracraurococcus ruber]
MTQASTLAAQVDAGRMMQDLAALARWQKLSGTPEEAESLRHIRGLLDGIGYRTTWHEHDAYVSLPGAARVTVDNAALKALTHSMSLPSPPGGLVGQVVDLGEGGEADFARAGDLRGCILLLDGIASPAAATRAAAAGAAGQLHVSPHEHLHEMCISPVWGSPCTATMASLPRTVACTISHADGTALRDRLARGEAPRVALHAEVDTGWRRTPILVAEMEAPSAAPEAPFILFSGHHDTWYYGVMDNGAANATMLEVARLCATRHAEWKRGLRLCFWSGHSHGRYSGSAWYADEHFAELDRRCAVHVNVDSTGGVGATVLSQAPSSAELRAFAAEAMQAETGADLAGRRMARNSDQSFWGIGIPSLFAMLSEQAPGTVKMRNSLGWWWHTPDDLLDKIDPANLARDTRVYVHAIARLLEDARLPLDHAAPAEALAAELAPLAAPCTARGVPLDGVLALVAALRAAVPEAHSDAALMRACRALVPLDYTTGDRFAHDPALPMPPWPVLDPLRALAAATGDAVLPAAVAARRARNRLVSALGQAVEALRAG